jgi:hypothetical protein
MDAFAFVRADGHADDWKNCNIGDLRLLSEEAGGGAEGQNDRADQ